jgi:RimJ/RimL family protein N-acetyltransferase
MSLIPVTLTGRLVRLEPLTPGHLTGLARHGADRELWLYMKHARPDPLESLHLWRTTMEGLQARGEGLAFAIFDKARKEAVGGTCYFDWVAADRRLEIGHTWLGRAVWRTGVNTETKALLLRHAFEALGCNRVQLKTDGRNLRSQAAIERIGAKKEGVLRQHMVMPDGFVRDTVMYSITAAEWPEVKARLDGLMKR